MPQPSALFRVIFGGLFFLAGAAMVNAAVRRFRKAGTLLRARPTSAGDLSAGDLATVDGEVVPQTDERVPAHFLGREGVAVATEVKGKSRTGAGGGGPAGDVSATTWKTKHRNFESVPFAVADATGRIAVRPPDIEEFPSTSSYDDSIRLDGRTVADRSRTHPSPAARYDEHVGTEVADVDADRRFEQAVVEPGDEVTVTGRVVRTEEGNLALGHRRNPDAFTLSMSSPPSATGQLLGGLVLGAVGLPVAAVGGVVLATLVPGVEDALGRVPLGRWLPVVGE